MRHSPIAPREFVRGSGPRERLHGRRFLSRTCCLCRTRESQTGRERFRRETNPEGSETEAHPGGQSGRNSIAYEKLNLVHPSPRRLGLEWLQHFHEVRYRHDGHHSHHHIHDGHDASRLAVVFVFHGYDGHRRLHVQPVAIELDNPECQQHRHHELRQHIDPGQHQHRYFQRRLEHSWQHLRQLHVSAEHRRDCRPDLTKRPERIDLWQHQPKHLVDGLDLRVDLKLDRFFDVHRRHRGVQHLAVLDPKHGQQPKRNKLHAVTEQFQLQL